jgi:hypothetical protein
VEREGKGRSGVIVVISSCTRELVEVVLLLEF